MSDSTDNTNELDSYGVWVKRPPKDALQDDFSSPQEETESFDSSSIDLPEITDFDETSFENPSDALSESEANTISEDIFNTEEMTQTKDISQEEIDQLRNGVEIDGYLTKKAQVRILKKEEEKNLTRIEITIHEGRNRQIRKMMKSIGKSVVALHRSKIGNIQVNHMKLGQWRYLTEQEINSLR